jgi:catechol 2,3-dioxygenase-like lactoylglutathione lyase family enzyme
LQGLRPMKFNGRKRRKPIAIARRVEMLDHIGFSVADYPRAKAFYTKALAPLGITCLMEVTPEMTGSDESYAGFGRERPQFWIGTGEKRSPGVHVAFSAADRKTVDDFYAAAMAAGGRDNGKPGLRPQYHPDYYGAFVFDPDGHNIEAVCHRAV